MAYTNSSVFWVGQDGNIYLKNGTSVQNAGKALSVGDNGFDSDKMSVEASHIADPNPGNPNAPQNPNNTNGTGGSSAPVIPDKSNDIALQQAGLAAVDSQTSTGLSAVDRALQNIWGQYDSETASNEGNYHVQSDTNQNNHQANKQTALVNAAQGRQGLMGTLASLGALSGDGITLANRAVQHGANEDLTGAANTYATNQASLDTAIGTYREQDKQRRQNATVAAEDAKTNVKGQAAKSKQQFYSNMANDYSEMGNAGEAKRYSDMAGSLYGEIANNNVPSSNLAHESATFTPGTLGSYLAGANNTAVTTSNGGTDLSKIPGASLVATTDKKKLQA